MTKGLVFIYNLCLLLTVFMINTVYIHTHESVIKGDVVINPDTDRTTGSQYSITQHREYTLWSEKKYHPSITYYF